VLCEQTHHEFTIHFSTVFSGNILLWLLR